ncbi:MAG: LPS-assembly protein LptD [Ignavibacteria bacterium]|nr:LPS-assembly protein LptD [Ignavibacteria bacterium]
MRFILCISFVFYSLGFCLAQTETGLRDTTFNSDSLKIISNTDSLSSLTLDTSRIAESDIDAVIEYTGKDSIVYDLKNKKVYIYNQGILIYKDLRLEAGKIVIDQETQLLEAFGIPDSLSKGNISQTPIMTQGSDKYEGSKLFYNFKTRQGSVSEGFSEAEVGYYFGDKIKKESENVLFIKNGIYTTSSDREDPEYYFLSPRMKVIPNDKVIAQSVFLYIEGVPIFWIPFGVFPNRSGRTSGLIAPTFGDDGTYGKYISRLGYFWAVNDYMDIGLTGSYFTKGRYEVYSRFRYASKYNFTGSLEGGYSRIRLGESTDIGNQNSDSWGLNFVHNQQINPTTRVDANMQIASSKNFYNVSTNALSELLLQNLISNFTFSKNWEEKPYSLNLNYYRDQNLQNGDVTERLPLINFSVSQIYPFESGFSDPFNKKIYEYISFAYSGSALNNRLKRTVKSFSGADSTYTDMRSGVRNFVSAGLSPKFQFISLNPFFNYNEIWYNKYINKNFNPSDSSVSVNDNNAIKALRYFNTGISFSTKFVGIFLPNVLNITGIRHTVTPALTYNYQPDFSDPKWGYYKSYKDQNGNDVKYSIYEKEIFGGAPSGESQSLGFSIGNVFEMKTRENDTTENKFQLLNIDAGVGYNFAADSLNFSEIFLSYRTSIGSFLNISGGTTFNLYKFDQTANTRINKFLLNTDGKLANITNFNINMSTNFSFGSISTISENGEIEEYDTLTNRVDYKDFRKEKIEEIDFNIPFSGGFGFNYSESKFNPSVVNRSSNLTGNMSFNLTEKWRFTVSANYDLVNKQIVTPYITAYRDLNSWEMNFNWYPSGTYRGFSFEVRIKAPQLRDIKVTKKTNTRGVY